VTGPPGDRDKSGLSSFCGRRCLESAFAAENVTACQGCWLPGADGVTRTGAHFRARCRAGRRLGAAGGSAVTRGSHSSQPGRYQFLLPSSFIIEGTSTARTVVASIRTAAARPTHNGAPFVSRALLKKACLSASPSSGRRTSRQHPGRGPRSVVVGSTLDAGSELHVAKEEVSPRAVVLIGLSAHGVAERLLKAKPGDGEQARSGRCAWPPPSSACRRHRSPHPPA
jgi:hypothetical protein